VSTTTRTPPRPALRLGLTGGIGSGKTTVAGLLAQLGACVLDADALSRACTQAGGAAMPSILKLFGPDFVAPDGSMNRQRMRDHVFAHPQARRTLEGIIHPLVASQMRAQVAASGAACCVFDVPLLVESPRWRHQLDRVLVVDCSHATQVRRVMQRNGWDAATVEGVIRHQASREQRLAAADGVIDNDTDDLLRLQACVQAMARSFGL